MLISGLNVSLTSFRSNGNKVGAKILCIIKNLLELDIDTSLQHVYRQCKIVEFR